MQYSKRMISVVVLMSGGLLLGSEMDAPTRWQCQANEFQKLSGSVYWTGAYYNGEFFDTCTSPATNTFRSTVYAEDAGRPDENNAQNPPVVYVVTSAAPATPEGRPRLHADIDMRYGGGRSTSSGDFDEDGWVGLLDLAVFVDCMAGPGAPPDPAPPVTAAECLDIFDADVDGDVDWNDFGAFQLVAGRHTLIPLRDSLGGVIMVGSTTPYSGRQTCGVVGCHDLADLAGITNGLKFQQGRTDVAGNVIMQDDYFADGRWWQRSPGRFGIWDQPTTLQMAGKENASESVFDQSTFAWIRDCGGCHVGAGPGEFDRDGQLLYNEGTEEFGYELLGKTPEDVVLDGDYADLDFATGTISPARWDITGLSGPDCLFCHRREPPNVYWRRAALGAATELVDDDENPVEAFAAAATAGQGWLSNIDIVQEGYVPKALMLQIDYAVGLADGSLIECPDNTLCIDGTCLAVGSPLDQACWTCHVRKEEQEGMVWWDDTPDVHYRQFNNLSDDDPDNDISGDRSTVCVYCHPGGLEHNIAKGSAFMFNWRNGLDWVNFRSCRDCHLWDSPDRHPDAPDVGGGTDTVEAHLDGGMMVKLSCQACHIPYALSDALVYFDSTAGGIVWPQIGPSATTMQYYSADPLDPSNPDKSRWYPALMWKEDSDGVDRLFPCNPWPNIHWADWDQNGTPEDLSDDLLTPIIEWRMYQVIGDEPLPVVTDDDGDGRPEMNRPEEMLAYMALLKGNDSYARQIASNPVLVKGPRVWYEDPEAPDGVSSFEHEGTGIPVKWWYYNLGLNHNVLPKDNAWGAGRDCQVCHCQEGQSPVFDRLILVDPYDPDGQPVYETVREMTGVEPPW